MMVDIYACRPVGWIQPFGLQPIGWFQATGCDASEEAYLMTTDDADQCIGEKCEDDEQ